MIVQIIRLLHLILVIGILASVFVPNKDYKIASLVFLIYILFQYLTNYGRCGLTEIEYLFKKEKYQEGFLYRLIKPIITVPEKYFDKYLFLIHIILIVSLSFQIYYMKYI
jgi:hypothetical protein